MFTVSVIVFGEYPTTDPSRSPGTARITGLERDSGKPLYRMGGYCTCLRAIRGKTPTDMEAPLGFAPGYF